MGLGLGKVIHLLSTPDKSSPTPTKPMVWFGLVFVYKCFELGWV